MTITKKSLNYVFEITKYLYFNLEIDQEIELKKLRSTENDQMFAAALDFIIDRNLTLLGGFQIRYTDENRTSIKKIPHVMIEPVQGYTNERHVMPFDFKKCSNGEPIVLSKKYEQLFEYGNT